MRIVLFFVALFFFSCQEVPLTQREKERAKIRSALEDYIYPSFYISDFPVLLRCTETADSVLVMAHGIGLFHKCNISLFEKYDQFADALADVVSMKGYLQVDSALFRNYNCPAFVITPSEMIDSIFANFGLEGLIHNYIDEYGIAKQEDLSTAEWNYLRYLFFQNDILFFWDNLSASFCVSFYHIIVR